MKARALVALLLALAGTAAGAQEARGLAATCAACHGTNGRAIDGAALPGLAGIPATVLAAEMRAFKSGARAGTLMPQLAKGFSEAQIDQLAAYFAAVPP